MRRRGLDLLSEGEDFDEGEEGVLERVGDGVEEEKEEEKGIGVGREEREERAEWEVGKELGEGKTAGEEEEAGEANGPPNSGGVESGNFEGEEVVAR